MGPPPGVPGYYLLNDLQFEHPERHAIDPAEPVNSTLSNRSINSALTPAS